MKGTQFITNISSIISGFWNGNEMIKKWIILFLITGPCTTNSGGCQELCYPLANAQYSCGCSSGYTLNGVACESSELREGRANSELRPITSYIQSHCSTINQSRQRLHLCQWKEDHDWVNRDKWSCVILVESICISSRCRPYCVDYQELHVLALWFDRKRFKVEPIKCTQLQIKVNLQRRCYFVVSLPQSHITKQLVFIQFSLFLVKLLTKTTSCW